MTKQDEMLCDLLLWKVTLDNLSDNVLQLYIVIDDMQELIKVITREIEARNDGYAIKSIEFIQNMDGLIILNKIN